MGEYSAKLKILSMAAVWITEVITVWVLEAAAVLTGQ